MANETMKAKLQLLFIGLALIAGIYQTTAQVTNLGIAPAGRQSLIYWPASSTNYVLQTVTNLTSTNWVTARTAFAVNTAEVTNSAASGFFRLIPTTTPAGMALIPAGWFTMGNSIGDSDITDANPTNVYVSAFVMDVNLVNYGLWINVYAYATGHGYNFVNAGVNGGTGTNYPVTTVNWFDCVKWSNARSQQAGLTPVYYTDAGFTQVFTNGELWHHGLSEFDGERVSAADGSGMGEGGARRWHRVAFSVGQSYPYKPGPIRGMHNVL
jgi:hypothetical protein